MNNPGGRQIKNILALPPIYFFLFNKVRKQRRFIELQLTKELYPYRLKSDGSLTSNDFKKITGYYALGVPGIVGESLCVLRGRPMLPRERLCLTYLGGISGLLDDLFDDPGKEFKHLEKFIFQPEEMKPANLHEKLLLHFYQLGLHYSTRPGAIKEQAGKVFHSQQESLEHQIAGADVTKIEKVTLEKGGASFLFYRLCLEHEVGEAEKDLLYRLGGLMQLGNDIFDVWEDFMEDTATVATLCSNIQELRRTFITGINEIFTLAYKTPYKKKDIRRFNQMISLALTRVFVCLDQFEKLQKKSGGNFNIADYSRKQLICDMERPVNHIKAIHYFLKMDS